MSVRYRVTSYHRRYGLLGSCQTWIGRHWYKSKDTAEKEVIRLTYDLTCYRYEYSVVEEDGRGKGKD